jgi:Zn-dependent protease with chaperone function
MGMNRNEEFSNRLTAIETKLEDVRNLIGSTDSGVIGKLNNLSISLTDFKGKVHGTAAVVALIVGGLVSLFTQLPSKSAIDLQQATKLINNYGVQNVFIQQDPEFNAYTFYNDDIYVNTGLLEAPTTNEDNFLVVLFHEEGHRVLGHVKENVTLPNRTVDKVRQQEVEADIFSFMKLKSLGLLNEKSCKMDGILDDQFYDDSYSTHPANYKRRQMCLEILNRK